MEELWADLPFVYKTIIILVFYFSSIILNLRRAPEREVQRISRLCSDYWIRKNAFEISCLEKQMDWIEETLHFYTEELLSRFADCLTDSQCKYLILGKYESILKEAFKREIVLAKFEIKRNQLSKMKEEEYENWVKNKSESHRTRVMNFIHRAYQDKYMLVPFKQIVERAGEREVRDVVFKCYNFCRKIEIETNKELESLNNQFKGELYEKK
jgi:hypothetical protein